MSKSLWDEEEYIITLYLYRFGYENLGFNYSQIAAMLGRSPDSIIMRFANYLCCEDNKVGLKGGGEKTREMYKKYIDYSELELRKAAIRTLVNKTRNNS